MFWTSLILAILATLADLTVRNMMYRPWNEGLLRLRTLAFFAITLFAAFGLTHYAREKGHYEGWEQGLKEGGKSGYAYGFAEGRKPLGPDSLIVGEIYEVVASTWENMYLFRNHDQIRWFKIPGIYTIPEVGKQFIVSANGHDPIPIEG